MNSSFTLPDIKVVEILSIDAFNDSQPLEDRTPWKDYD